MDSSSNLCARCNKLVYPTDLKRNYQGKTYHSGCFKCSFPDCSVKLTERTTHGVRAMPYCPKHRNGSSSTDGSNRMYEQRNNPTTQESREVEASAVVARTLSNLPRDSGVSEKVQSMRLEDADNTEEVRYRRAVLSSISDSVNQQTEKKTKLEIRRSIQPIFDNVSEKLLKDLNIVVCGSPRAGKSTLINSISGRKLTEAKAGMNSVTQEIRCHTVEGQFTTESEIIRYRYNFWDTPGFESWEKNHIRSKVEEILDKPSTKPLCMIFCTAPTNFVNVTQLEWLLDKFITKRHIFCALVCTNKHAGSVQSRNAVLAEYHRLLSNYAKDLSREENGITFYGNVGLVAAVNCEPFETDRDTYPVSGLDELNYGIIETLVDDQVMSWCMLLLENKRFWDSLQHKAAKGLKKNVKRFMHVITGKTKKENKITKTTWVDYRS